MGSQASKSGEVLRVFAVSDLHTDAWEENCLLVESFTDYGPNDVLIVAGDVAEDLEVLRRTHSSNYCWIRLSETDAKVSLVFEETLTTLSQSFGHVFYITGNNELRLMKNEKYQSSFHKREAALKLAQSIPNVYTEPKEVHGVWIVPLHSWYEPTLDPGHKDFKYLEEADCIVYLYQRRWRDFSKCYWGEDYHNEHNHPDLPRVCKTLQKINKPWIKSRHFEGKPVITFSHFLPRRDLLPSTFWFKNKTIPYVMGSPGLEKQIRQIKPVVHIFGHSHINVDQEISGVRYVQNAMAHPHERNSWLRFGQGKYQPKCIFRHPIPPNHHSDDEM